MTPMLPDPYSSHKVIYPVLVQPKLQGTRVLHPAYPPFPPNTILDGVLDNNANFNVFDVVSYIIPFDERLDTVAQILRDAKINSIKVVPTRKVFDEQQANDQFDFWLNEGYTGMIYRLGHCLYTKPTPKNPHNHSKQLLLRKVK